MSSGQAWESHCNRKPGVPSPGGGERQALSPSRWGRGRRPGGGGWPRQTQAGQGEAPGGGGVDKTNGCSGPPGGTLGGAWAPQAELVSTVLEAKRCTGHSGHSLDAYCVPGPHVSPGGGPRDGLSRSPGWVWDRSPAPPMPSGSSAHPRVPFADFWRQRTSWITEPGKHDSCLYRSPISFWYQPRGWTCF